MRIISKYRDYYDIGMQYGQDEDITWVREKEELKTDLGLENSWFRKYTIRTKRKELNVQVCYLAYCGKLYEIHSDKGFMRTPTMFASSRQEMEKKFSDFAAEEVINPENSDSNYWIWKKEDLKQWISKDTHELHRQFDCPVILLEQGLVTKCPVLKDLQFQRVKDPYTAFQEISIYISGVMGAKTVPTVTISDKSKIVKHGFDLKYGFRTRPKE